MGNIYEASKAMIEQSAGAILSGGVHQIIFPYNAAQSAYSASTPAATFYYSSLEELMTYSGTSGMYKARLTVIFWGELSQIHEAEQMVAGVLPGAVAGGYAFDLCRARYEDLFEPGTNTRRIAAEYAGIIRELRQRTDPGDRVGG